MSDELDPDIEWGEGCCPQCGHEPTYRRDCTSFCEDGYHDDSDEDFLLPGSRHSRCNECNGHGGHWWCPKCGYDLLEDPEKLLVDTQK